MKNLIAFVLVLALVLTLLAGSAMAQSGGVCPTCVKVRVALALAQAQAKAAAVKPVPVPSPTPEPAPTPESEPEVEPTPMPTSAPVRIYRMGSLPANFVPPAPAPVYYSVPAAFCPTGNCPIPGR